MWIYVVWLWMFPLPLVGVAEYCDDHVYLFVCLFVCQQAYLWNCMPDLHQIFAHVTHGLGSVLFWWRRDTLCTVYFRFYVWRHISHKGECQYRCSRWRHSVIARRLISLLRCIGYVVWLRLDESVVPGLPAGGGACNASLPCCVCSWCRYWSKWLTYRTRCGRWVSLHRGSTVCWQSSSTRSQQAHQRDRGLVRTTHVAHRPPSWPRVCWRWICWLCLLTCYIFALTVRGLQADAIHPSHWSVITLHLT